MKALRKPYFASFLAFLILFMSCSPNTNHETVLSIEEAVQKHLELSRELSTILINEKNVNIDILQNSNDIFNNTSQIPHLENCTQREVSLNYSRRKS